MKRERACEMVEAFTKTHLLYIATESASTGCFYHQAMQQADIPHKSI